MNYDFIKNRYFYYDEFYYYTTKRNSIIKKKLQGPTEPHIVNENIVNNIINIQEKDNGILLFYKKTKIFTSKENIKFYRGDFVINDVLYDKKLRVTDVQPRKADLIDYKHIVLINNKYDIINNYPQLSKYELLNNKKKISLSTIKEINPWFSKNDEVLILNKIFNKLPKDLIADILYKLYR